MILRAYWITGPHEDFLCSCIKEIGPSHVPGDIKIKIEDSGLTRTIFPIRAEFVYLHEGFKEGHE